MRVGTTIKSMSMERDSTAKGIYGCMKEQEDSFLVDIHHNQFQFC